MNNIMRGMAALAAAVLLAFGARADESDYLKLVGAADDAVAAGEWGKAQQCYREAMKLEPDNPSNLLLLANLGMVQHYNGEDSLALVTLTQAHAIAPKSVTVLANRGKVLFDLGRPDDAAADFTQVLELDSVNTTALFNRGYIRLRKGDWAGAESDLKRYHDLAPDDLNSVASLAVLYSNQGKFDQALPMYNDLIKGRPSADAYAARAFCLLQAGRLTEASEDISEGLKLEPENGELYYCRAYLNLLRYLEADAKADAKRARELGIEQERIDLLFQ